MSEKLKRYLVFACDSYYPAGGWDDFKGSYDTLDEAKAAALEAEKVHDWSDIVDCETGQRVSS